MCHASSIRNFPLGLRSPVHSSCRRSRCGQKISPRSASVQSLPFGFALSKGGRAVSPINVRLGPHLPRPLGAHRADPPPRPFRDCSTHQPPPVAVVRWLAEPDPTEHAPPWPPSPRHRAPLDQPWRALDRALRGIVSNLHERGRRGRSSGGGASMVTMSRHLPLTSKR